MSPLEALTISGLGLLLTAAGLTILAASWHELRQAKLRRKLSKHPHSRVLRRRPLINVVIITHNNVLNLENSLNSLISNRYRKYTITLISAGRNQRLSALIRRFRALHPNKRLRLVVSKQPNVVKAVVGRSSADLTLICDQPVILNKFALRSAANRLALEPNTDALSANCQVLPIPSIQNLTWRFKGLMVSQILGAIDSLGGARLASSRPVQIYRREAFSKTAARVRYAPDFLAGMPGMPGGSGGAPTGQKPFRGLLTPFYAAWRLLAVALATYGIYLAAAGITAYLLAIMWAGWLTLIVLSVWGDNHLRLTDRLRLTALAPAASGMLYLDTIIGLGSDVWSMIRRPALPAAKSLRASARHQTAAN